MALTAKTRRVGNVAIIDLNGRITLGESTGILRDELRSLLSQGSKQIILNMAGVTYVDSAGLGELVGSYASVTNMGGNIKLLNPQAKVHDLLQVTKLYTVFAAFDDESEAIRSFGAAAGKA